MSIPDPATPAGRPDLLRQAEDAAGQRRQPVRLRGWQREHDPATGEIIAAMNSSDQPDGHLLIRAGTGASRSARRAHGCIRATPTRC